MQMIMKGADVKRPCNFNSMASWRRQNYGDSKKVGGCRGLWARGKNEQAEPRIYRAGRRLCMIP